MGHQMKVGFIGLGNMGNPMASRLLKGGFQLTVFDAREEALQGFVEKHGGYAARSIGDLGKRSDVVITSLPNGDVVRRVVLGDGGNGDCLVNSLSRGSILVDMSSSSPVGTKALGGMLEKYGMAMLDAPVSGGVVRAKAGTLTIMVGGNPEEIERCRPVFRAMGDRIFETGPLGSGHAIKVLNNLVSAAGLIAAAEALLVGRRFGLNPAVMIDIFNASTGRNNSTENKFNQFVFSRSFNSGFSLDFMVKDLNLAVELARDTDTPILFGALCRELWALAKVRQKPGADHTEVVRWFEEIAGAELR